MRDLTLFFYSWTFGNCRVDNNWQNWNSYSCNEFHGRLHNCRFKSLHLVLFWFLQNSSSTYRVGWSKYLFLANEWKKKNILSMKISRVSDPFLLCKQLIFHDNSEWMLNEQWWCMMDNFSWSFLKKEFQEFSFPWHDFFLFHTI